MRTYTPRQTREWSSSQLDALIGKQVTITVNGTTYRGVVDDAACPSGTPFVRFDDGGSFAWNRHTDEVHVTVEED